MGKKSWIESHTCLIHHPKLKALANDLRLRRSYVLGHLHSLWHAVLEFREDGDVSSWTDQTIADYADFPGSAPQFVRLLYHHRFLDGELGNSGPRRLLVHDWLHYAGKYLRGKYHRNKTKLSEIVAKHTKEGGNDGQTDVAQQLAECCATVNQQSTAWLGMVGSEDSVIQQGFLPLGEGGLGEGAKTSFAGVGYATPNQLTSARRIVRAYQESTRTAYDPRGAERHVVEILMRKLADEQQLLAAVRRFGEHVHETYPDRTKRLSAKNFFGGDAPAWSDWVFGSPIVEAERPMTEAEMAAANRAETERILAIR